MSSNDHARTFGLILTQLPGRFESSAPAAAKVGAVARAIYMDWWPADIPLTIREAEIARTAFHLERILAAVRPGATILDIGGGWGSFAAACALLGYRSILVDDFGDRGFADLSDRRHEMIRSAGVMVSRRDVLSEGVGLAPRSIDAVTSFDSLEHWHHSPRGAFQGAVEALRPGGLFLVGVPNCASVRKRITLLFGHGKWSAMADWYDQPTFRGHVREPDVDDLVHIAQDLELIDIAVFGRNWQGLLSSNNVKRIGARFFGPLLTLRPSLCADIYVEGRKPL